MVISPGGWRSTYGDFFRSPSNHVQLFTFSSDHDGIKELSPDFLSREQSDSSTTSSHSPCASSDVGSRIFVLETRGDSSDPQGSASSQISQEFFNSICSTWRISPVFLERMSRPGSLPRFEYLLDQGEQLEAEEHPTAEDKSDSKRRLHAIDIGFQWGPGHGNFIIALGKYHLASRTLNLFLSSNGILEYGGWLDNCELLGLRSVSDLMARYEAGLRRHPLTLVGLLMQCCERFIDLKSQQYNLNMLRIGTALEALYPSAFADWFKSWNLNSTATSEQNTLLFDCYNDVTWTEKNCLQLRGICTQYLWLSEYLEKAYHHHQQILPKDIVRDVIHRTDMHSHMIEYLEKMITTQFNHQYNHLVQKDAEVSIQISRATKKDGESMKTLAYLTLFFLPITFVCAIFSTTIFNFENWDLTQSRVVSPGWWVFVLSCLTAMIGTIGAWFLLIVRQQN